MCVGMGGVGGCMHEHVCVLLALGMKNFISSVYIMCALCMFVCD